LKSPPQRSYRSDNGRWAKVRVRRLNLEEIPCCLSPASSTGFLFRCINCIFRTRFNFGDIA
jgi:hypothetical protein